MAMPRFAHHDPEGPFHLRVERNGPPAFPSDETLEGNPNKGATRIKILGVHEDWSQPLRIEKWIFPKRIRPAYYIICPGTFLRDRNSERVAQRAIDDSGKADCLSSFSACSAVSALNLLPPLSTCKPGRKARGCPQRALKLLLVQCTMQEKLDADLALSWLRSLSAQAHRVHHEMIEKILHRYAPIMELRCLMCPRCLGAKYGNYPETVRQGWRRRHGKANARPRKRKGSTD